MNVIKNFDEFINEDMSIGVFSSITDMLFPMFKNAKEKHKLLTGMPPFAFYKDNWGQYPLDKSKKIKGITGKISDWDTRTKDNEWSRKNHW